MLESYRPGVMDRLGFGQERIKQLEKEVAGCNQVIGELTIANRISKKVRDGLL